MAGHRKSPSTITAETISRYDEKTSAGRAKMLSGATLETDWQRLSRYWSACPVPLNTALH